MNELDLSYNTTCTMSVELWKWVNNLKYVNYMLVQTHLLEWINNI